MSLWTEAQVKNMQEYQKGNNVHPYTCCGDDMNVTPDGLECLKCKRVQTNVSDQALDGSITKIMGQMFASVTPGSQKDSGATP